MITFTPKGDSEGHYQVTMASRLSGEPDTPQVPLRQYPLELDKDSEFFYDASCQKLSNLFVSARQVCFNSENMICCPP
jgi:hypothetical protein